MSGLEVLAVVGLIGQCWEPLKGIIKLMNEVYNKVKEFNEEYESIPVQFRNLHTVLATLHVVLERVEQRSKIATLERASRESLVQILYNCKLSMEELKALFDKHYIPNEDQPFAKIRRALHILAGETELASIQSQIDRYINAITAHSSAFAPTAHEISNTVTSDLEKIMDQRYERLENLLRQNPVVPIDTHLDPISNSTYDNTVVINESAVSSSPNHSTEVIIYMDTESKHLTQIPACESINLSNTKVRGTLSDTEICSVSTAASESSTQHGKNVRLLNRANELIVRGSENIAHPSLSPSQITRANTQARRAFLDAISTLNLVTEQDCHLTLRKYRGLTHASLCLTTVTKAEERDEHIGSAEMYNAEACVAADRCFRSLDTDPSAARIAKSQVMLDSAGVRMRQARIATKRSTVKRRANSIEPETGINMAVEAFQIYSDLASEFEETCWSGADYDIRAQCQLGCGEVVQMLQTSYGCANVALLGYKKPQHYYDLAIESATTGNQVVGTPTCAQSSIRRSLTRIHRSQVNRA